MKLPEVNGGKEMAHSEKQTGSEKLAGKVKRLADLVDY